MRTENMKTTVHNPAPDEGRYVIVVDGIVVNSVAASPSFVPKLQEQNPGALIIAHDQAGRDWRYIEGEFFPPAPQESATDE